MKTLTDLLLRILESPCPEIQASRPQLEEVLASTELYPRVTSSLQRLRHLVIDEYRWSDRSNRGRLFWSCLTAIDDGITLAARPYPQICGELPGLEKRFEYPPVDLGLTWGIKTCYVGSALADAQSRLARIGLAARAFREEHGEWPERLDELVPAFLPRPLDDPLSGVSFRLEPTLEGLRIAGNSIDDPNAYWTGPTLTLRDQP